MDEKTYKGSNALMEYFKDGVISISVRNLVEFILRSGDIDNRGFGVPDTEAMAAGTKIHRKIQKSMGLDYKAEVPLRTEINHGDYRIIVEGRADGIIDKPESMILIDEIKGTYKDIRRMTEPVYVHKAQAMCYGFMYGAGKELSNIRIRITYVNLETEEVRYFDEEIAYDYLEDWFHDVIDEYIKWADYLYANDSITRRTASALTFPFEYREGQRDIVTSVYKSILRKKNLFVQAPTGVGKTMSVIFPAIKAIGGEKGNKLFYLTAKTITRTVAVQALDILKNKGLSFKSIVITAKDKVCTMEETKCNPEYCIRAKGHYDRVNDAIYDVITHEYNITRDVIDIYANKHNVCPYELSLDISNWVSGIICDYNYAFDPNVCLKRYFSDGGKGEYILLVDEAHNLVDRAREMYSATLIKEDIMKVKKLVMPTDEKLAKALERCNKVMLALKRKTNECTVSDELMNLPMALGNTDSRFQDFFEKHKKFEQKEEVMELYFRIKNFLRVYENMDDCYKIYRMLDDNNHFFIKLLCVNPSGNLREYMDKAVCTVFFSATLLPVNYYKELFTGDINEYAVYIPSPFEQKKRLLLAATDVSSKYTRRGPEEYERINVYIKEIVLRQKGNYMVFFPSYRLMEKIYNLAVKEEEDNNIIINCQNSGMNEKEREEFLETFEKVHDKSYVAFCVMGGIFSEGIDLTKDRLIGTIIVGTGLPQIGFEKDIIMNYFEEHNKNGFDYAYRFPGMNKVLQAAGRVIRTKDDVGVIALLDDRFVQTGYKKLFPREWDDCRYININNIQDEVNKFWMSVRK